MGIRHDVIGGPQGGEGKAGWEGGKAQGESERIAGRCRWLQVTARRMGGRKEAVTGRGQNIQGFTQRIESSEKDDKEEVDGGKKEGG